MCRSSSASNVPGSKLKWHEVIVHKNVFRDCVKHVAMQRCHIAQFHDGLNRSGKDLLHRYQREGDDFLGRIVAMVETWTRSYEPNFKRQSNEWKHPGSPRPKKVRPTQSAVKVMFIVAYDVDGGNTAPCCTSKADGKRGLLEHPPYSPDMIHVITIFSPK
ncbi:hypothetical protein ANN_14616 [Periplaneta americana]|uniref:Uncharacterized protein n=1 Tax=Periplaneta americana TaxID=6978 RepID=A0ABQ8SWU6_PERAM|nr:hypothetical protein ANN_14616 [Periplaneta americana]